jgi:two-component system sensor histidine kinase/response regulator
MQSPCKDTGIGISREHQRTIFEPFSQADGSATRRHGGTGWGLMQGKIWVESELGKGSTFPFSAQLKLQDGSSAKSSPRPLQELQGMLALVVDGNSVNHRVLRGMLSHWGMKSTDVEDGAAALQVMRIAKDIGHPFSVVLLDGPMRGMDGFSIAEQIKKDPSLGAATIMMLTSVGHVGDAARCRDLGIAAYLVEPIRLSELANALCIALERTSGKEKTPLVTRPTFCEANDRLPHPA